MLFLDYSWINTSKHLKVIPMQFEIGHQPHRNCNNLCISANVYYLETYQLQGQYWFAQERSLDQSPQDK
jgi:hypothetical protein